MKKLIIFCIVLSSFTVFAQEKKADSLSHWKKNGVFTLLFNQSNFSNWVSGGENTISGTVSVNYDFNYKKDDWAWDNRIIAKYGINRIEGETKKTDDLFEFNTLVSKKATEHWSYSFFANIRSQFSIGYDYDATPIEETSGFFAPGYLTFGPGMIYKKSDNFNINLSPLTSKATFVSKKFTATDKAFGVNQGETLRYELGFYASVYYKVDLMKNVSMENIFNAYSNYIEDMKNIDINYQINFVMQVNKYLSTNLNLHMIADDNASTRVQFKQVFGLGVNYIF